MRALSIGVLSVGVSVLSFALAGCPAPQAIPDAGDGCPANSEPTERGTCQCFPGYTPNPAGTACVPDNGDNPNPGTPDAGPTPPGDDGGAPDGGTPPGGDCTPQPYPEADSRAYFDEHLKTEFLSCGYCHATPPGPVNGDLQFNADTAWQVAIERIEPGAATAADTTIGQVLRVDGSALAIHPHPFNGADAAKTWIEYHLDGVLPAGCE